MLKKISARHFDLTDEMRQKAESEMDGLTRFFDNIISAEMVLDTERHVHKAELLVKVYNSTITGTGSTDDMYNSIDMAIDKVKSQLKKHKGKLKHKNPEAIMQTKDALTKPSTDIDEVDI
ncbi:MAG TPA: ribosome-associated translation inhibitor RaiA [candidate division Zixibacteria bacterium]|jgi:putative sigma-54 modulation protein|nr:ribosome-associated translation inhibitor RaiA [candidate division Zixibacteria bacterium]